MKTYLLSILAILACNCAIAQSNLANHTWKITLKIIDEQGNPLPATKAGVGFFTNSQPTSIDGVTDTNGLFSVSQTVGPSAGGYLFGLSAEKDGCYATRSGFNLMEYDAVKWNPTITLVLKRVGKPIAMYAKSVNLGMPVFDKPAGFDFMAGDWVSPYGKGKTKDIIFSAHLDQRAENDADYTLTVSFPKNGDGIQEFIVPEAEKGSGLRSPHEAPVAGYLTQWVQTRSRKPGQSETGNLDANRNFIFRVRTVKDHAGNIVSAQYGKIYGDFLQFRYYLNPTPNDRNIEFDPKQNLIHSVQSFEQVNQP
jgi:hypothetical protein